LTTSITPVKEETITKAIIEASLKDWSKISNSDVVVVGAGPAGLTASYTSLNQASEQLYSREDFLLVVE